MGLQKAEMDNHGNSYAAAYMKVSSVMLDTVKSRCNYSLNVYKDKTARDEDKSPVKRYTGQIKSEDFDSYCGTEKLDEKGMNLIKSLYAHIKEKGLLKDNKEVKDVLE